MIKNNKLNLLHTLILLTLLFITTQLTLFLIHYKVTELVDALVNSSISSEFFRPVILLPIIQFISVNIIAYVLLIACIWFIAYSLAELFKLSPVTRYFLGLLIWFLTIIEILSLNHYYFPDSFFAQLLDNVISKDNSQRILLINSLLLAVATSLAYFSFFRSKCHRVLGSSFLLIGFIMATVAFHDRFLLKPKVIKQHAKPNIIFIGLDSLRPDFTGYFGKQTIHTPHINQFLRSATTFTQSYTPLARTFPAWISILTAKHPKHSHARNNLIDPSLIFANDTIAKQLQQAGYETIYATDEKRFSNITKEYGFDQIIGPGMGINDFILGGLNDFPLTNLLINSSIGRFLFPYNYANRAAAITYEPNEFLKLVKLGLAKRSDKPLFFAIHFCLSHWPYTWSTDGQGKNFILPLRYQSSVEAVDAQLGSLLQILKDDGLLAHSVVVLLSDHGTTLGLLGDRFVSKEHYLGDPEKIKLLSIARFSSASEYSLDFNRDYSVSTSYGQGTDVLSLKQYHTLLAFKGFGLDQAVPAQTINQPVSLMDIAPTVLDLFKFPQLKKADGISLKNYFADSKKTKPRNLFMETGDSLSEIETDHIYIEKVVNKEIGIYKINAKNGLLSLHSAAEQSLIKNKQLSILSGDWLLARYPASLGAKLVNHKNSNKLTFETYKIPAFFVLTNLKTGEWTFDLTGAFAKKAPLLALMRDLQRFYQGEFKIPPHLLVGVQDKFR